MKMAQEKNVTENNLAQPNQTFRNVNLCRGKNGTGKLAQEKK